MRGSEIFTSWYIIAKTPVSETYDASLVYHGALRPALVLVSSVAGGRDAPRRHVVGLAATVGGRLAVGRVTALGRQRGVRPGIVVLSRGALARMPEAACSSIGPILV